MIKSSSAYKLLEASESCPTSVNDETDVFPKTNEVRVDKKGVYMATVTLGKVTWSRYEY